MKKLLLALVIFLGVERFCYFQTDGFILSKMLLENAPPLAGPSETLTFIGAGKQFYAFETADHQYVVKFMKFSRRRPLPWLEKLTFLKSWSTSYLEQRAKRLSNLEYSSRLALQHLASEAALAPYPLPKNLILIDKLGIAHFVDTSQTKFIVQKKAVPFTLYFDQNPSQAQTLISSYIKTVSSQCKKGICNLDPIIERNYGIVDNQTILMDIGSLLAHPKLNHKAGVQREIFVELLPLRQWLQNNHPEHVDYFDQSLHEIISSDQN
jgi:hypothetical protein